jgi:anti-sigma regulatory factor (Ser/Thr protein kinase)
MVSVGAELRDHGSAFRHDAFLYEDAHEFLAGAAAFAAAALAAGDPLIVALDPSKTALLRSELGRDARKVCFADMREIGANPARLIPAWRRLIETRDAEGRRLWGIGEPIVAGRSEAEVAECHRHEALTNIAFADVPALSFLCAYDLCALHADVIAGARRTHPTVLESGLRRPSPEYTALAGHPGSFEDPLPEPRALARTLVFGARELREIRALVEGRALAAGLALERREDIVLAVNEIASNSVRHGGGSGVLRIWRETGALICEVSDGGRIVDPLAGRERPAGEQIGGYGLWLANQVCDLVQVRSGPGGSTVRVHMRTA